VTEVQPRLPSGDLPQLQAWRDRWQRPNFGVWDFLDYHADVELAAAFASLFWPEFVEVDGFVLLAARYTPESLEEWRAAYPADRRAVESVLNEVHVYDLFSRRSSEGVPLAVHEYVGQVLRRTWSCALEAAFPDRRFELSYRTEPHAYGPTLTFWQL
jgi:hypothetical protein